MNSIKSILKKILPAFVLKWYHFSMALLAAIVYKYPSKKIKVIGITGTNGKSTTVEMVTMILEEANYKVAVSSSVRFQVGEKKWSNESRMTMPGRFALQKLLRTAISDNCQYAVIEVSSEGIKQYRHRFIDFNATILTNVTPEHLESHGSFINYLHSKGKLFKTNHNIHIINLDDENSKYFINFSSREKYLYTIDKDNSLNDTKLIRATNYQNLSNGSLFWTNNIEFKLSLLGEFNIYNALAAICLGLSQNISLNICKNALNKIKIVPGRMEQVIHQPIKVFIDYAVTPDSLEKAYQTVKNNIGDNKLICVLGSCGGGRDKWKRPILGKLAKKYCDQTIVTNEDPYDEKPIDIINEIAEYNDTAKKIVDRREAIKEALKCAGSGDTVIITGKGCENSMCVGGGKKIAWNDKNVTLEESQKIFG